MAYNYIITCGTSQLDLAKLTTQTLSFTEREVRVKRAIDDNDLTAQNFYEQHRSMANRILQRLSAELPNLGTWIGNPNNPFGAEISTLQGLVDQHREMYGEPADASYVLLASDSCEGYFSARILVELLKVMTGKSRIELPVTIGNLVEKPDTDGQVNDAMVNLVDKAYQALLNGRQNRGIRNVILMTGGFKSILPCLTLFATVYGLELVYLFEKSVHVERLTPMIQLKDKGIRDKWVSEWELVLQGGGVPTNSYLYRLLQTRVEHRDEFFYS